MGSRQVSKDMPTPGPRLAPSVGHHLLLGLGTGQTQTAGDPVDLLAIRVIDGRRRGPRRATADQGYQGMPHQQVHALGHPLVHDVEIVPLGEKEQQLGPERGPESGDADAIQKEFVGFDACECFVAESFEDGLQVAVLSPGALGMRLGRSEALAAPRHSAGISEKYGMVWVSADLAHGRTVQCRLGKLICVGHSL